MRDSFVFKKQWREGISLLPQAEQAEAMSAILDYALENKPYSGCNGAIKMLLALISREIDENNAKYSQICEKRMQAAKERWSKRVGQDANASKSMQVDANGCTSIQMDANASKSMQVDANGCTSIQMDANASKSMQVTLDNDNDNDSDIDIIVSDNNIIISSEGKKESKKESNSKELPKKQESFSMKKQLLADGLEENLVDAYMKVRKSKKAPDSQIAYNGLMREATKAGITIDVAITECVERNWIGFKADWYLRDHRMVTISPRITPQYDPEVQKELNRRKAARMEEEERSIRENKEREIKRIEDIIHNRI